MSCCINPIDLGCIDGCGSIDVNFKYTQTGVHKIYYESQFTVIENVNVNAGDAIVFNLKWLLENAVSTIHILQPDGTFWNTIEQRAVRNCFKIKYSISNEVN